MHQVWFYKMLRERGEGAGRQTDTASSLFLSCHLDDLMCWLELIISLPLQLT